MAEAGGRPKRTKKRPPVYKTGPLRKFQGAPQGSAPGAWLKNGKKWLSNRQNSERRDEFRRYAAAAAGAAPPAPPPVHKRKRPPGRGGSKAKRLHPSVQAANALEIEEAERGSQLKSNKGLNLGAAAGPKRVGEGAAVVVQLAEGAAAAAASDPEVQRRVLLTAGKRLVSEHGAASSPNELDNVAIVEGLLGTVEKSVLQAASTKSKHAGSGAVGTLLAVLQRDLAVQCHCVGVNPCKSPVRR